MPIDPTIPVAAAPTGGQAFALTPAGRIPASLFGASLPYQAFTPAWTSSGTAPAIGNATVTARYVQVGKLVHFYGAVVFGSTSTFGTGAWAFSLPVPAVAAAVSGQLAGSAYMFDSSAVATGVATASLSSTSTLGFFYGATYLGTFTAPAAGAPWTWATNDQLGWNITYEAA